MAEEPWNKVNIPIPSAVSLSRITFSASTGDLIERLLADCERVLTLLCSSVLQTEIRVLYEILYVLNNSFRQHKPFRAIKQVEQCINRLKEMNLRAAIEDLKDLCPNQYQRDAGTEMGECDVPSQPMLEWICLKLLGASSLLARTMDRTIRAFLRTRQHLHLTEFIVLNTVLTSMLSRLWVFFRGILKALIPMYQRTTELLQQVAQSQPMPYLTDFTLPEDLKTFLGPLHPELQIEESTTEPLKTLVVKGKQTFSFLSKLFGDKEGKEEERGMIPGLSSGFDVGSSLDLGTAVLKQRPEASPSGLLMKDLLQRSCKHSKQILSLEPRVKLNASNQAAVHQKRKFLKALRTVSSFRDMAAYLKEMIYWCKCCKFWIERKRLAYLSLKCLRMESLEAEGLRVERRLKTFKLKVQKAVMLERTFPAKRSCSLFALWRTRWHPRARFRSSRYGTVKHRSSFARMCTTTVKDLFGASLKRRTNCYPEQSSVEKVSGCNVVPGHEEEKLESQSVLPKQNIPKDDIDDIFASIGF